MEDKFKVLNDSGEVVEVTGKILAREKKEVQSPTPAPTPKAPTPAPTPEL